MLFIPTQSSAFSGIEMNTLLWHQLWSPSQIPAAELEEAPAYDTEMNTLRLEVVNSVEPSSPAPCVLSHIRC